MSSSALSSVAIILLAAGESRRMGFQKQLLPIGGKPMVRCAAEVARQATTGAVVVVIGANATQVSGALAGLDVDCTINPEWSEGMGSSLRHGMQRLGQIAAQAPGVLVLLADQPGMPAGHLTALLERHASFPEQVIATENRDIIQPPILFPRTWFARLASLTGDQGAKSLLRDADSEVQRVSLATLDDVDTPEDYDAFTKHTPS